MRSRVLLSWLAGTLGGVLAWMVTEVLGLARDTAPGQATAPASWSNIALFGLAAGAGIGGGIGLAYGAGSAARLKRAGAIGAVTGAIGGMLGFLLGQMVYGPMAGRADAWSNAGGLIGSVGFLLAMAARTLGWGAAGFGLGALQGFISGSGQRSRAGAIGGLAGGLLGGFLFELLAQSGQVLPAFGWLMQGPVLRLIGLTVTGSAIGLLVGLTEQAIRQAWVRVVAGRNEGTEFLLEKQENAVGRDELADVPLFGDPAVQPRHALISRIGGGWVLDAQGPGVLVNGQPVQRAPLADGDVVRVVSREVEFHQKGSPRRVPSASPALAPQAPAVLEGICPYCGQTRTPEGLCACAPAAAPAPPPPFPTQPSAPPLAGVWRLIGIAGPYAGRVFTLGKAEVTVGRDGARDVSLTDDGTVSRQHARIIVSRGGVEVVDDGSSNGTFVNGQRVSRTAIHQGDELKVGASRFRLEGA